MNMIELLSVNGSAAQRHDKIYGVVTGIVQDIKDPQNLGRVKVDFPWLAERSDAVALSDEQEEDKAHSYWARMATLMAGNGRGTWLVPEVGDEVAVAFEHGHVDRPIICGVLWNDDSRPPERMDDKGENNVRAIHSRSGHKVILNDSDEEPSIMVVDKTGQNSIFIDSANNAMQIKVGGDLSIKVGGDINIAAQGKINVDAGQDITAQAQANLKIKATGGGDLEATGPLNITSKAQIAVDGTGQAEVKAISVNVNGSAMTQVKGGLVMIN